VGDESDNTLADFIEQVNSDPDDVIRSKLLQEELIKILASLTSRERQIITLRFGFEDDHDRTLEEIGKDLHVTRERVRQIEERALRKLKTPEIKNQLITYIN
jgi:RNA polymerase primary sigma factor